MSTDWTDKVVKLLRKAEETDVPAEAETFMAKAQELMTKHSIDEAMLADREDKPAEEIVEEVVEYAGVYRVALRGLGHVIAKANSCRSFYCDMRYSSPRRIDVHIIGYESDVARVKMLNASAQLQLETAKAAWVAEQPNFKLFSSKQKKYARRDFAFGFVTGLAKQLEAANKIGKEEAAKTEAEFRNVSAEEASESVELVLRSREDNVNDWFDKQHGGTIRTVHKRYRGGGMGANAAGRSAGMSADVGGSDRVAGGSGAALGAGA